MTATAVVREHLRRGENLMHTAGQRSLDRSLDRSPQRLALVAVRTARIAGLTVLALVIASAGPGYGQAQASPPSSTAGPSATPPVPAGRVVLRNARFDSVRVEVRAGPSSDCGQNVRIGVATLPRGSAWGLTTDKPVCYRHEAARSAGKVDGTAASGLAEAWTAWTQRVVGRGQRVEEQL
ncbi:MAG: hypothetical protein ACREON_08930 [Gemmatimonadaceae bacterium]